MKILVVVGLQHRTVVVRVQLAQNENPRIRKTANPGNRTDTSTMNTTSYQDFASFFHAVRKEKKISLRAFCELANADPGNISRLERRAIPPPQDRDILSRYASALGLTSGSDEWYLLFDLAAADRGIIPQDLMDDEALVQQLPAFFRTLRGQKPTAEELGKIIEQIRKS